MDDEIKDMFFRLFLLKTIKIAKKGRLHRFFRIFAVRGVRLTFRDRPSLNLPSFIAGFFVVSYFRGRIFVCIIV